MTIATAGRKGYFALTPRQLQVLNVIRTGFKTDGFPPSRAEIARELGLRGGSASVYGHINALVAKGHLIVSPGKTRGLRLAYPDQAPLIDISKDTEDNALVCAERTVDQIPQRIVDLFEPRPLCFITLDQGLCAALGAQRDDIAAVHATDRAEPGEWAIVRTAKSWKCTCIRHEHEDPIIAGTVVGLLGARPVAATGQTPRKS